MTFLTITNFGYVDLAENLALNFQQTFMSHHRLIVDCMDELSLSRAATWKFKNIRVCDTVSGYRDFAEYGTTAFQEVVKHKFPILHSHLNHENHDVWYLDGDIGIFEDPAKYIRDNVNVQMQADEPNQAGTNWCTGCFVVRNTAESRLLFSELSKCKYASDTSNDQRLFNGFVRQNGMDICGLDVERFQNGFRAINCNWWVERRPAIVHVNYRRGKKRKIDALMRCGKWFKTK